MRSDSREEIVGAFDALGAEVGRVLGLSIEALTTPELLAMLARCQKIRRQLPAIEHHCSTNSANRPPRPR
jgi:hypothetical protein